MSEKSDTEMAKPPTPRWKVLGMEIFVVIMAIVSMVSAWDAYVKMKNASSDVEGIVNNWKTLPITSISMVANNANCASDETELILPSFLGASDNGCGCMAGAYFERSGESDEEAESGPDACLTNQTSNADYKCRDIGSLSSYENKLFKDNKICYKRGLTAAVDTPYPDADTGECGEGFFKCGAALGTFDEDRVFCAKIEGSSRVCPVTWFGSSEADVLNRFVLSSLPTSDSDIRSGGNGLSYQIGEESKVPTINQHNNWSPLPIVDIEVGFQRGNDALPCYGELDLQDGARHDEYASVSNHITSGIGNVHNAEFKANSPSTCEVKDTRWAIGDQEDHSSFYTDNMEEYSPNCKDSSGNYISANVDYFNGGAACVGALTNGMGCIGAPNNDMPYQVYDSSYGDNACYSTDDLCKQAFYQTKCGAQNRMHYDAHKVGFFQRTQIYWKQDCAYDYSQVIKNNGPLQKAIDWQTNLFYLNAGVNSILICFSLYIIYLTVANWGTMKLDYVELEEVWKPRAELFGNWIKIPVVVLTIVFASAVSSFFVDLSKESCSDSMTDATFLQLGTALPQVIQANIIVLAMDFAGLVPILYKKFCGSSDEEENAEVVPADDNVELTSIAVNAPSAPAEAPTDKEIVYADGPATVGGEGTIAFPDGGKYRGFIFKGMRHNDGRMKYADGHYYDGKWKNDLRDGYGSLELNDSTVYKGEWFQDNRQN